MAAPKMSELQRLFWQSINQHNLNSSLAFLPEGQSASQRINIYRTNVKATHLAVLSRVYPTCRAILGDKYFKQLALGYIDQTPSTHPDMNKFGDSFPVFIAQCTIQKEELKDLAYLGDLASLEWMLEATYYSADESPFDAINFQRQCSILGKQAILKLQPGVSVLSTPYPIYAIWQSHRENNVLQEHPAIAQKQYMCIYKQDFCTHIELIDQNLFRLLNAILNRASLDEITRLYSHESDLQNALSTVVSQQWLAGLCNNGGHNEP